MSWHQEWAVGTPGVVGGEVAELPSIKHRHFNLRMLIGSLTENQTSLGPNYAQSGTKSLFHYLSLLFRKLIALHDLHLNYL